MGYSARTPGKSVEFSTISEAFALFKSQPAPYAAVTAVYLVVAIGFAVMSGLSAAFGGLLHPGSSLGLTHNPAQPALNLLSSIIGAIFTVCLMNLALRQLEGKTIAVSDAIPSGNRLAVAALYVIVVQFLSGCGFVLCIVPGFILQALLAPGALLVLSGVDIGASLAASSTAMKPHLWAATGLMFVLALICAVGILACIIGSLVALPVATITIALLARDQLGLPGLSQSAENPAEPGAWPPPSNPSGDV